MILFDRDVQGSDSRDRFVIDIFRFRSMFPCFRGTAGIFVACTPGRGAVEVVQLDLPFRCKEAVPYR